MLVDLVLQLQKFMQEEHGICQCVQFATLYLKIQNTLSCVWIIVLKKNTKISFKLFIKFLDRINTRLDIISIFHKTLLYQRPTSLTQTSINLKHDHNIITAAQEQDEIQWHNILKVTSVKNGK